MKATRSARKKLVDGALAHMLDPDWPRPIRKIPIQNRRVAVIIDGHVAVAVARRHGEQLTSTLQQRVLRLLPFVLDGPAQQKGFRALQQVASACTSSSACAISASAAASEAFAPWLSA